MNRLLLLSLLLLSFFASNLSAKDLQVSVHGKKVYIGKFGKTSQKPQEVTQQATANVGDFIETDNESLARITLPGNGKIVLSPLSKVFIRSRTDQRRYIISLMKGDVFFQVKEGKPWSERSAGAIINIKDFPTAYYGEAFRLKFSPQGPSDNFIHVKKGPVKMLKLNSLGKKSVK